MTVNELKDMLSLTELALPKGEREIEGAYIGDLLSWVMGRAESGNAWITIMSNVNILAVATLSDVSCVILAEGVTVDDTVCATATEKGINVLTTSMTAYEVAVALAKAGI